MCVTQDSIDSFLSLAEIVTFPLKKQAHALSTEEATSVSSEEENHLASYQEALVALKVVLSLCFLLCSIDLILPRPLRKHLEFYSFAQR